MKRIRLWITLVALAGGTWATDLWLGRSLLERSGMAGMPLPPFGLLTKELEAELQVQLRAIEKGAKPAPVQGFDPDLGWTNRMGRARNGTAIGPWGTRGERVYSPQPAPGVLRLACFGTSFVYGSEVADDETFCAQLEALDPGIEALNFGVGGYGTDQALLRMRRHGLRGARVAILGLCLENIGRNVNRYRALYAPAEGAGILCKPRFLLKQDRLELLPQPYAKRRDLVQAALARDLPGALAEHDYWAGDDPVVPGSWIARALAAKPAHARRLVHRMWMRPKAEPYRVTLALVEAFRSEALAAGAERVWVLVFARRVDLESFRAHGQKYWQGLLADLDQRGIEYLDLATRLIDEVPGEVYRKVHHSPRGNAIVAEELRRLLGRDEG